MCEQLQQYQPNPFSSEDIILFQELIGNKIGGIIEGCLHQELQRFTTKYILSDVLTITSEEEDTIIDLDQQFRLISSIEINEVTSYGQIVSIATTMIEQFAVERETLINQYHRKINEIMQVQQHKLKHQKDIKKASQEQLINKIKALQRQNQNLYYEIKNIQLSKIQAITILEKKLHDLQRKLSKMKCCLQTYEYQKLQQDQFKRHIGNQPQQLDQQIIKYEVQYLASRMNELETKNILSFEIEQAFSLESYRQTEKLLKQQRSLVQLTTQISEKFQEESLPNQCQQQIEEFIHQHQGQCIAYNEVKSQMMRYQQFAEEQIKKLLLLIKKERKTFQEQSQIAKKQIQSSKQAFEVLDAEKVSLIKKIQNLLIQNGQLRTQNSKSLLELQGVRIQTQTLKKQIVQLYERLSTEQERLKYALKNCERIEQQNRGLLELNSSKSHQILEKNRLIECQSIQLIALKETIETLRNFKSSQHKEKEIVDQMIQKSYQTRIQNKEQKTRIQQLETKIESLQELNSELKATLQTYRVKLNELDQEMASLKEEQCVLTSQNRKIREQIQQTENIKHTQEIEQTKQPCHEEKQSEKSASNSEDNEEDSIIECSCHPRKTNPPKYTLTKTQVKLSQPQRSKAKLHPILKRIQNLNAFNSQKQNRSPGESYNEPNIEQVITEYGYNGQQHINSNRSNLNRGNNTMTNISTSEICTKRQNSEMNIKYALEDQDNSVTDGTQKFKYRIPEKQKEKYYQREVQKYQLEVEKHRRNVLDMNQIVNYLVNCMKGYTRNGIRNWCWIAGQGQKYLKRALSPQNIKLKYENFQKIRQLCQQDKKCRELIKNVQTIMEYYFQQTV